MLRPLEGGASVDHSALANEQVIDRLVRIEQLLENLCTPVINNAPSILETEFLGHTTPSASNVAIQSPMERRHNHTPSVSDLIVGHSLKGLSRIIGHPTPQPLLPLAEEDGETYLDCEVSRGEDLFRSATVEIQNLDLSPRTCWRLKQSFTRSILPWCPFVDQEECDQVLSRTCDSHFPTESMETCFVLFILALGSIVKEDYRGDAGSGFGGLEYFQAAAAMVSKPQNTMYSIMAVQCRILMTFYLLLSLRTIQAFDTIHQASLAVLGLLQFKSRMDGDVRLRQHIHRAYWACYLIEHELQSIVSYSSCLMQLQNEFVPLPLFEHDEPGSYWFLSEIAFRRIFSNSRDGFGWSTFTLHRDAVVNEIVLQLQQWYGYLPAQIKFPMTLGPLMDSHKVFLRAQYYAVVGVLHWSFVVRLLTSPPRDEQEHAACLKAGRQCLESCILHVHTVESLMQERHLMLFANISGLNCVANLLVCTYNIPALRSIQPPQQEDAIRKARNMLAIWSSSPIIASYVSQIDRLMTDRGINVMSSDGEHASCGTNYGALSL